jgi:small-conductance mechanosensitive channel
MQVDFHSVMGYSLFGNSGREYAIALGLIVAGVVVLKLFRDIVLIQLRRIAKKTRTEVDDFIVGIIHEIHWPLYFVISSYIALQTLVLNAIVSQLINSALVIGLTYYIVHIVTALLDYLLRRAVHAREKTEKTQEAAVLRTAGKILKGIVWAVAVLFVLSNLGYNVTTLIAGLGIGGLAIAFALQKVLEDIFSSISIYFDKPFEIGDFIVIGDNMGVVKRIGIKSTRIQALQGEEIIISNRELTSVRIQNFKKMERRRVVFSFGVVYQTSNAKLKRALEIVKEVVKNAKLADIDRVHFKSFGNSSLDFEGVYYLNSNDYNRYMDTQQEINIGIKEAFEKEKIEFAYPTQTVYLAK